MAFLTVIDYDSGNTRSVEKAVEYIGGRAVITHDKNIIQSSDGVILPGVGAFGDCMKKLKKYDLVDIVYRVVEDKKPFLGICVGLQLLFEKSFEFGEHNGLGLIKGLVKKFPSKEGCKIPHMGWNSVEFTKENRLFNSVKKGSYFYFVHSFYAKSENKAEIAQTNYILDFTSAVNIDNLFGVQFHPEKSQTAGLQILKNFCNICEGKL